MSNAKSIGIVAGWGEYPLAVARALREKDYEVVVAAIHGHASKEIETLASHVRWIGVCKLGGMQRFFRQHDVNHVCLSGKLFKDKILYHGWGWVEHLPDWECLKTMMPQIFWRTSDFTDNSLLGAVVTSFGRRGMTTVSGTEFATQLIAQEGFLTRRKPSNMERDDIEFGWTIAKQMGGLDIGQSVTVRDRAILAVEAIEGTDACIVRTGQLCPRGGFTLVKVAKPDQDMRFDLPTIGPLTIEKMALAGGKVIAIEAGKTIVINRDETIRCAEAHGIAIVCRS